MGKKMRQDSRYPPVKSHSSSLVACANGWQISPSNLSPTQECAAHRMVLHAPPLKAKATVPFLNLDRIWSITCAVSTIDATLRHVMHPKNAICVNTNAFCPQKMRNANHTREMKVSETMIRACCERNPCRTNLYHNHSPSEYSISR